MRVMKGDDRWVWVSSLTALISVVATAAGTLLATSGRSDALSKYIGIAAVVVAPLTAIVVIGPLASAVTLYLRASRARREALIRMATGARRVEVGRDNLGVIVTGDSNRIDYSRDSSNAIGSIRLTGTGGSVGSSRSQESDEETDQGKGGSVESEVEGDQ
jgi:hypothetical protein